MTRTLALLAALLVLGACEASAPQAPAPAPAASATPAPTPTAELHMTCLAASPGSDTQLCRVELCQGGRCVVVTPPPG